MIPPERKARDANPVAAQYPIVFVFMTGNVRLRTTCHNASRIVIICYNLIHMEFLETAELVAFTTIVAANSLSKAARELGVPRATIGRRLARLEKRLGVRLLRRTTRSLKLTDAGDAFHRNATVALEAVRQAEESVRRASDAASGPLRVSMPPMTDPGAMAMLVDFAKKNPDVQLQAHFTSRVVDLQRDGYDVALRATPRLAPGLVARTLTRSAIVAVAAPKYLERHGTPRTARDLKRHRCILGFDRGEVPQTHWPLVNGKNIRVEGVFFSNELTLLRAAVIEGLGIALLPRMFIDQDIESGKLVHVLPGVGTTSQVALVYQEREFVPAHVRAFIDHVVRWSARGMPGIRR
jgi:DNA-binding transcriptional LysR family regulator